MPIKRGPGPLKTFEKEYTKAEKQLARTKGAPSKAKTTKLSFSEVSVRTALFQPRTFTYGLHSVDLEHVEELAKLIYDTGELNPLLVFKIGKDWVCVDGHHRLAAYNKVLDKPGAWDPFKKLTCEVFHGSLQEAVDEAWRRNTEVKLAPTKDDRMNNSWRRVVLGWGSKAELVALCGVSDGQIGKMRRALKKLDEKGVDDALSMTWRAAAFRAFGPDGEERREPSKDVLAHTLANSIMNRFGHKFSEDAEVTARALRLLDKSLPKLLTEHWRKEEMDT